MEENEVFEERSDEALDELRSTLERLDLWLELRCAVARSSRLAKARELVAEAIELLELARDDETGEAMELERSVYAEIEATLAPVDATP